MENTQHFAKIEVARGNEKKQHKKSQSSLKARVNEKHQGEHFAKQEVERRNKKKQNQKSQGKFEEYFRVKEGSS